MEMEIQEFIELLAEEFDTITAEDLTPSTVYQELDDWSSLTALGIIGMVKYRYKKSISGLEVRSCRTVEDLFNLIMNK